MTEIATVSFTGQSGKKYDFKVFTAETSFHDVSAVYIMSKRTISDRKGSHKLLYIGETGELGTRLAKHEKWPCAASNGANAVCVHLAKGQQSRLAIETDLRNAHQTPCNDQ